MKKVNSSSELVFTDEELPVVRNKSRLIRREIPTNIRQTRSTTTAKQKEEMNRAPYLREESSSSSFSSSKSSSKVIPSLPPLSSTPKVIPSTSKVIPSLPPFYSSPKVIDLVSPPSTPKVIDLVSSVSESLSSESELSSASKSNLSFVEKDESSSSSTQSESILVSSENSDERIDQDLYNEHYGLFNALKLFNTLSIREFNRFLSNPYIDKVLFSMKQLFINGSRGAHKIPFDGIMKSYWLNELIVLNIPPTRGICCLCLNTRTTTRSIGTENFDLGDAGPDCYELKVIPLLDLVDLIKRSIKLIRSKKYRAGTIGFDREIYRPFMKIVKRIDRIDIKMSDRY